jgi:hypothetical protein
MKLILPYQIKIPGFFFLVVLLSAPWIPTRSEAGTKIVITAGVGTKHHHHGYQRHRHHPHYRKYSNHCHTWPIYSAPIHCPPSRVYYHVTPSVVFKSGCAPVAASTTWVYSHENRTTTYQSMPGKIVVVEKPATVVETQSSAPAPSSTSAGIYRELGGHWGRDVLHRRVEWNGFVEYVRKNLLQVPSTEFREFRAGFIEGYGADAEHTFNRAYEQARTPVYGS